MKSARRLLIVEDDSDTLGVLKLLLRCYGYLVTGAADAAAGFELFKQSKFDLVLTDAAMPEVSGFDFARQIREINREVPIILLTAHQSALCEAHANHVGITRVLYKPIGSKDLASTIAEELIRGQRSEAGG